MQKGSVAHVLLHPLQGRLLMPSFLARQEDPSCKSEPADKATHHLEARQEIGCKSNVIKHPSEQLLSHSPCHMLPCPALPNFFRCPSGGCKSWRGSLYRLPLSCSSTARSSFTTLQGGCHNPRCISFVEAFAYHLPHITHTWEGRVAICGNS